MQFATQIEIERIAEDLGLTRKTLRPSHLWGYVDLGFRLDKAEWIARRRNVHLWLTWPLEVSAYFSSPSWRLTGSHPLAGPEWCWIIETGYELPNVDVAVELVRRIIARVDEREALAAMQIRIASAKDFAAEHWRG